MARPAIHRLTVSEVEYIAFSLAQELMEYGEPIPPFDTRYPDKLESCLQTPFQTFNRKSLYPTFEGKAAMLFYLMVKNHPFQNGNKRVAVVTLYYFLRSNHRKLKVSNIKLYEFAKEVAASDAQKKDEAIAKILSFIINFSERIAVPVVISDTIQ
ncbi:MAG: Fic family protein [bacterium]|nr:Fic family protein [bacterium]